MFVSFEYIACLLLKELSKMFERLFIDNVEEEKMWELLPKFFTLEANITLFLRMVDVPFKLGWIVL